MIILYMDLKKFLQISKIRDINIVMLDDYQSIVTYHTENLIRLIDDKLIEMKLPEEINIVTEKKQMNHYDTIYEISDTFSVMAQICLPYYYIDFVCGLVSRDLSEHLNIICAHELLQEHKSATHRPDQHMILLKRYVGMGYYVVLSTFLPQTSESISYKNYFIWLVGGSNIIERDGSLYEFNKLNKNIIDKHRKLQDFDNALYSLLTFDINKEFSKNNI